MDFCGLQGVGVMVNLALIEPVVCDCVEEITFDEEVLEGAGLGGRDGPVEEEEFPPVLPHDGPPPGPSGGTDAVDRRRRLRIGAGQSVWWLRRVRHGLAPWAGGQQPSRGRLGALADRRAARLSS